MELSKIKDLINLLFVESLQYSKSDYLRWHTVYKSKISGALNIILTNMPEHEIFIKQIYIEINEIGSTIVISQINDVLKYIISIIDIEMVVKKDVDEYRFFDSANDKYKQAGLSYEKDDYSAVFNNLNSAFELIIKDKLGIPSTITKINTAKIVDILVKYKIEPYLYLSEAEKRILQIDNKVKHQGYNPNKIDAINGMKSMEELLFKIKEMKINLTDELKNKIFQDI
jgi:hypothetical protein